jgi:hypothetical protein
MVDEDILKDMNFARNILKDEDCSIVVIKDMEIISKKHGNGIKPILETIIESKDCIYDSVIGDRILGKASALLCRYAKVKGVYSPQATKIAIAILITANIPSQIDKIIPYIKNFDKTGICPFEELLKDIDSPRDAFMILKENIFGQ